MDDDFGDDADFTAAIAAVEKSSRPPPSKPQSSASSSAANAPKVQQPTPQALPTRAGPSSILVSTRQKGNPILASVRQLPWEYSDIPADYVLGATTCALFLSLKYHRLHPEYIYARIRALAGKYNLRILLTMVDIPNHEEPLKELSKTSLINNLTLILCWSAHEAGRYLELYKSYEYASPTSIRAHQATSYAEKLVEFITVPRSINKTDAVSLVSAFGSIRAAVNARPEEIAGLAGWGERKVERWCGTVREPFRVQRTAKRGLGREESSARIAKFKRGQSSTVVEERSDFAGDVEAALESQGRHERVATEAPLQQRWTGDADKMSRKRPADSAPLWSPSADGKEEGAESLFLGGDEDHLHPPAPVTETRPAPIRGEREDFANDEGVAAALAKLRQE